MRTFIRCILSGAAAIAGTQSMPHSAYAGPRAQCSQAAGSLSSIANLHDEIYGKTLLNHPRLDVSRQELQIATIS